MHGKLLQGLLVLTLFLYNVRGIKRPMMCEPIPDGTSSEGYVEGRPGKAGPRGFKGEKGEMGLQGTVDNGRINELIERAISGLRVEMNQNMNREMSQLNQKLADLEAKYNRHVTLQQRGLCQVYYNNKCFVTIAPASTINAEEGIQACRGVGGSLGNVYSREHFEQIVNHCREKIKIGWSYINLWTGMTVDKQRRTMLLSDGTSAPYQQWYPNRPYTPARSHGGIHIDQTPSSGNQGIFDEQPLYKMKGVLCEIEI